MFRYVHKVQYYETDKMGITHHANYIHWMEEARVSMMEEMGWSYGRLEAEGISSPVVDLSCAYKASTTFGDEVEVEIGVEEYRGIHLVIGYTMRRLRDGELVLEGTSRHVFVGEGGRLLRLSKAAPGFDAALQALIRGNEV